LITPESTAAGSFLSLRRLLGVALQNEISGEISARLRPASAGGDREASSMTDDPEAYQLYLKGRFHWNKRTAESIEKGLSFFQQAVARDPDFALAHVGVADSYLLMEQYADRPAAEVTGKAEAEIRRAIALNEGIAEAHATLGLIHQNRRECIERARAT
jgi:hypothetical protein